MAPLQAVYKHVPKLPQLGPEDPGPFAFASEARVQRILGEAGFSGIAMEPCNLALDIAIGRGLDAAEARSKSAPALQQPPRRPARFQPRGADAAVSPTVSRRCRHRSGSSRSAGAFWPSADRLSLLLAAGGPFQRPATFMAVVIQQLTRPLKPKPALPRSSRDGRWSAPLFPCPARSPIPAANGRRARRRRCWGRAAP